MCTSTTSPIEANAERSASVVAWNDRLPTYKRLPMSLSIRSRGPNFSEVLPSDEPPGSAPGLLQRCVPKEVASLCRSDLRDPEIEKSSSPVPGNVSMSVAQDSGTRGIRKRSYPSVKPDCLHYRPLYVNYFLVGRGGFLT